MFSRLEHEIPAVIFPKEWSQSLKQILLNIYGEKCIANERSFEVYGFSYPNEVVLIVSYVGLDKFEAPVTFFISSDLTSETASQKIMDNMFDCAGVFFDQYFAKEENVDEIWDDYNLDWEETEFGKAQLFFKTTRENIGLSMEADALLNE